MTRALTVVTRGLVALACTLAGASSASAAAPVKSVKSGTTVPRASCGSSSGPALARVVSAHFMVDFVYEPVGLSRADYVDALERTWGKLIGEYGWAAPPLSRAADGRYYVRVDGLAGILGYVDLGGTYGGRVGDNPNTSWVERGSYASCMVLRADITGGGGLERTRALASLAGIVAHEFTHSLQYGYGGGEIARGETPGETPAMMMESMAVMMAEDVAPEAGQGLRYLPPNLVDSIMPHSVAAAGHTGEEYRMWFVLRGMMEPLGVGQAGGVEQIVQEYWESMSGGHDKRRYLGALDGALKRHGSDLAGAYHRFALASWFMQSCEWSQVACFKDAVAYEARVGARTAHGRVDGTAPFNGAVENNYALQWLAVDGDSVTVTSGGELLVTYGCTVAGRAVTSPTQPVSSGRPATVGLAPGTCDPGSPTLVLTSASRTADTPSVDTLIPFAVATMPG
jgi:hypothetical protein